RVVTSQERAARLAADPTLAVHGKVSTYTNWGCRCNLCYVYAAAQFRAYRTAHKAEIAAQQQTYRDAHKEEIAARKRAHYAAKKAAAGGDGS
ncbi:MAG: hypothetical protein ACRDP1_08180, partial [Nocardioidaceae bacterium]